MQKEIDFLGNAVENPVRPFVAILGGAKVADKLNVISNLLEKVRYTASSVVVWLTHSSRLRDMRVGKSLVDETKLDYCKEMMEKAEEAWQEASASSRHLLCSTISLTRLTILQSLQLSVDADKMDAYKEGLRYRT